MRSRAMVLVGSGLVLVALLSAIWIALSEPRASSTGGSSLDTPARAADSTNSVTEPDRARGDSRTTPERAREAAAAARENLAELEIDRLVRGIVVDELERPIGGARVEALRSSAATYSYLKADAADAAVAVRSTTTGVDGMFALALPTGSAHELCASATGFALLRHGEDVYAGEFVRLALGAAARLEGIVRRTGDRAPVALAQVLLHAGPGAPLSTTTDAGGHYSFEDLPQGSALLQVIPVREVPRSQELTFEAGESKVVDVEVSSGTTVRGVVRVFGTNVPIAAAEVTLLDFRWKTARTNANGEYVLEGFWRPKANRNTGRAIEARAKGYSQGATMVLESEAETIQADIELQPAVIARGRVVDAGGTGVADVYVAIVGVEEGAEDLMESVQTTRTDASGAFEVGALSAVRRHTLFARRAGLASSAYDLVPFSADAREIELGSFVLPPGGTLAGLVVDERDEPIPGAIVELFGTNASRTVRTKATRAWFEGGLAIRASGSDSRGRFVFADVPAGTFRLRAYVEGLPPLENVSVTLAEGETQASLKLVLTRALAIRGVVLDPDGVPVADATVTAEEELARAQNGVPAPPRRPSISRTSSDAHGHFCLAGLVEGRYTVTAVGIGLATRADASRPGPAVKQGVAATMDSIVLQLPLSRRVEGRVTEGGVPLARAIVLMVDMGGVRLDRTLTDALGKFVVHAPIDAQPSLRVYRPEAKDTNADPIHVVSSIGMAFLDIAVRSAPR